MIMIGMAYQYSIVAAGGAYVGMQHSHKGLGYLLLVVALLNLALSLSAAKNPATFAKFMRLCHHIYLFGGRFTLILGTGMLFSNPGVQAQNFVGYWWVFLSILLWGVAEVTAKRLVKTELNDVVEGVPPSKNLLIGFSVELIVLILIFLCMIYRT
jgi:hypothetical protein